MRRLTDADRRAWEVYRRTADPLDRARRDRAGPPAAPPARAAPADVPRRDPVDPVRPFRIGQASRAHAPADDLAPTLSQAIRAQPVAMDKRAFHRLKAGKLRPEAKLDLHGMTLDRAHPALIDFVLGARARGHRLLLIVTGKGKDRDVGGPIPTPRGVLKHQVPQWLRLPPLAPHILQVTEAHRSHGGAGAYYVYLRRAA